MVITAVEAMKRLGFNPTFSTKKAGAVTAPAKNTLKVAP